MIHLKTNKGRYFFSSAVNIGSDSSVYIDENTLDQNQIKELLLAVDTSRVIMGRTDIEVLRSLTEGSFGSLSVNSDHVSLENITSLMESAISKLVDGAPDTYDTLKEISDWIGQNTDVKTGLNNLSERTSALENKELKVNVLTQDEYDNLAVKLANTLYLISE